MGLLAGGNTGASAGGASLLTGIAGTASSVFGDVSSGVGQQQQYNFQAQVASNNAAITRTNEASALEAANYNESIQKLQTGQIVSTQKAAQGANGVDVNVGSPVAVRASTAGVGAMDAAMLHYNAQRAAFGAEATATNYQNQAALYKQAGSNALLAGFAKAATSLASGASSVASKYAQFQLSTPTGGA